MKTESRRRSRLVMAVFGGRARANSGVCSLKSPRTPIGQSTTCWLRWGAETQSFVERQLWQETRERTKESRTGHTNAMEDMPKRIVIKKLVRLV